MAKAVERLANAIIELESDVEEARQRAVEISNDITALAERLAAEKRSEIRRILALAVEELERIASEEEERLKEEFENTVSERVEEVGETATANMDKAVEAVLRELREIIKRV